MEEREEGPLLGDVIQLPLVFIENSSEDLLKGVVMGGQGTLVDRSHLGPVFKLFWNGRLKLNYMGFFGLNIIYFNVFNHFGSFNHHK